MTDEERNGARTRREDRSRREHARVWWQKWKDPIFAAVLLPTAVVTVIVALEQRGYEKAQAENAAATAASAKLTCERTRKFAPYLIKDYRARDVFPPELLDFYESSLPRSCPK